MCVLDVLDLGGTPTTPTRRCLARRVMVPAGPWTPPSDPEQANGWLGLLVVEGLLTRAVDVDGLRAKELLGPGDVLRPWDAFAEPGGPAAPEWHALEDCCIAVLDARFAARAARWPEIGAGLLQASVRRSHGAAVLASASRARRADARLLLLFAHLAQRFGRVRLDGVRIPLRLTHAVIAELVCLRRPTVSSTLVRLRDEGRLALLADGTWLLPSETEGRPRGGAPGPSAAGVPRLGSA